MFGLAELIAVGVLALLCLAVRWSGFLLAASVRMPPKLERFIAAVPGPLLAAVVAASAAEQGWPGLVAAAAAALLMLVIPIELAAAGLAAAIAFLIS